MREAQQRHPEDFWINFHLGYILLEERPQDAVGYFRAAVASRPESSQAHIMLGRALHDAGDTDGAIAAFRKAIPLTSNRAGARDLARALAPRGGLEEARALWGRLLEASPPDYDPWDGYAQLCAFLGNEEAYRWARKALLERPRDSTDHWAMAERDSLACLLLPASGEELRRAVALVDRAVATGPKFFPVSAWLQFVKGTGDVSSGPTSASRAFAGSVGGTPPQPRRSALGAGHGPVPIRLPGGSPQNTGGRRPGLQLDGVSGGPPHGLGQPRASPRGRGPHPTEPAGVPSGRMCSRRTTTSVSRSWGSVSSRAATIRRRGYTPLAFTADPHLADSLTTECRYRSTEEEPFYERVESVNTEARYLAARCATLAGCGLGRDGAGLSRAERARWRKQARVWLRADLALWGKTLDSGSEQDLALAKRMLMHWQVEPDLAGIRDVKALDEASAEERNECFALWDEVGAVLRRIAVQERAIVLDPKRADPRRAVPTELLRQGRLDEARVAWQTALLGNPLDHNAWFGYAELCLFLGREDEYRRARRDLLARFSITSNPYFAERTGRACLLLPATGERAASGRRPRPSRRGVRPIG